MRGKNEGSKRWQSVVHTVRLTVIIEENEMRKKGESAHLKA